MHETNIKSSWYALHRYMLPVLEFLVVFQTWKQRWLSRGGKISLCEQQLRSQQLCCQPAKELKGTISDKYDAKTALYPTSKSVNVEEWKFILDCPTAPRPVQAGLCGQVDKLSNCMENKLSLQNEKWYRKLSITVLFTIITMLRVIFRLERRGFFWKAQDHWLLDQMKWTHVSFANWGTDESNASTHAWGKEEEGNVNQANWWSIIIILSLAGRKTPIIHHGVWSSLFLKLAAIQKYRKETLLFVTAPVITWGNAIQRN